ncbi:MAG TPA: XrtA system polysaccharide chain length determinant [Vicinamibacterales bacterium]|jgi:polysaccharide chain length determinant protein (PEP-CTERM system associated)
MLPGKQYKPEDILGLLRQRLWLIALPLVVCAIATFAVARKIPKKYQSQTLILVIPQRVPESYVRSTVTARIEDRLSSLREQILSRTRLEHVVQDFNLYPEKRRRSTMEDVIEGMRGDIDVKVERSDAFRVSYISDDPRTAQKVTERLASLFIEENLRDREVQAEGTSQFLDSALEEARRQLIDHEHKLEDYKRQHAGELPTQVQSNMQAIQSAQLQLQALTESINRDRDRRLVLERQVADLQVAQDPMPLVAIGAAPAAVAPSTAQQLDAAQARLQALELHYTAEHPDVKAMKVVVADLEAKLRAESPAPSPSPAGQPAPVRPATAAETLRQNRVRDLTSEMRNLDGQVDRKQADAKQVEAVIAGYQAKVDAVPTRESQLTELTRDYATLQNTYTTLLAKREDSKLAANLEKNQIGEQFKVLDPARAPERAYSPNVLLISAAGSAFGLVLGVGCAAFLEYRDTTFKSVEEIRQLIDLPVLALIPVMTSARERRAVRRRRISIGVISGLIVVGSALAVVFWKLQVG